MRRRGGRVHTDRKSSLAKQGRIWLFRSQGGVNGQCQKRRKAALCWDDWVNKRSTRMRYMRNAYGFQLMQLRKLQSWASHSHHFSQKCIHSGACQCDNLNHTNLRASLLLSDFFTEQGYCRVPTPNHHSYPSFSSYPENFNELFFRFVGLGLKLNSGGDRPFRNGVD